MSIDRDPIPSREQLAFEAYEVTGVDPSGLAFHVLGYDDGEMIEMIVPIARMESISPGLAETLMPGDHILYTLVREGEPHGILNPPKLVEDYQKISPINVDAEFS